MILNQTEDEDPAVIEAQGSPYARIWEMAIAHALDDYQRSVRSIDRLLGRKYKHRALGASKQIRMAQKQLQWLYREREFWEEVYPYIVIYLGWEFERARSRQRKALEMISDAVKQWRGVLEDAKSD